MNRPMTFWTQRAAAKEWSPLRFLLPVLGLCGLVAAGCSSLSHTSDEGLASVRIDGASAINIRDVAVQVFEENGYQAARTDLGGMVFEKQATALTNLAYGDWMGAPVWIRVKASIEPVDDRTFRLQCDAFRVRDKGASVEDEARIKGVQSGPYQKLLNEVARRLKAKAAPAA
jgi:hypothetical protein